jgi:hypothetical protein
MQHIRMPVKDECKILMAYFLLVGNDRRLLLQGSGAQRDGNGPRQRTRERRRTTHAGASCIRPSSWAAPVSTTVRLAGFFIISMFCHRI